MLPYRSVRRPEIGESPNIPNVWPRDDDADGRQVMVRARHVERRHRHDQDHHDLDREQRHDRDRDVRSAQDRAERRGGVALRDLVASRGLVGQGVRIRPKHDDRQDGRRADEDDRHEVGTGQFGEAQRHGEGRGGGREIRSDRRLRPWHPRRRCSARTPAATGGRGRRRRIGTAGWRRCRSRSARSRSAATGTIRRRSRASRGRRRRRPSRTRSPGRSGGRCGP